MIFSKQCRKCLLPENYPDVGMNDDQVCSFCRDEQHFGVSGNPEIKKLMKQKVDLKKEFENYLDEIRGKQEYDAVIPLSGGKDSTYLAYILKEKYNLKLLGVTVNTGLMSHIALPNVQQSLAKLNIDHVLCQPRPDFFKKLYKYYLLHPKFVKDNYEEIGYVSTICKICCEAIHSVLYREAATRNIPFVALGYSPEQIEHHFYETPYDVINKSWVPEELNDEFFNDEDRNTFWNPINHQNLQSFPRILFPFHVIDYPGISKIKKIVTDNGFIRKGKSDPLLTNCWLNLLMMYLDYKKLGYNSYLSAFSYQIRNNIEPRFRNLWLFRGADLSMKFGFYRNFLYRKKINHIEKHLGIKLKDILSSDSHKSPVTIQMPAPALSSEQNQEQTPAALK